MYNRLHPVARTYISGFSCTSFADYCDRLIRWDTDRLAGRASELAARAKRPRVPEMPAGRGPPRRFDAPVRARAIAPPAPQRQGTGPRVPAPAGQIASGVRQSSAICYGCREMGHYRSACPWRETVCHTCGRRGHKATACSQVTAASAGGRTLAVAQIEGPVARPLPPPPPLRVEYHPQGRGGGGRGARGGYGGQRGGYGVPAGGGRGQGAYGGRGRGRACQMRVATDHASPSALGTILIHDNMSRFCLIREPRILLLHVLVCAACGLFVLLVSLFRWG